MTDITLRHEIPSTETALAQSERAHADLDAHRERVEKMAAGLSEISARIASSLAAADEAERAAEAAAEALKRGAIDGEEPASKTIAKLTASRESAVAHRAAAAELQVTRDQIQASLTSMGHNSGHLDAAVAAADLMLHVCQYRDLVFSTGIAEHAAAIRELAGHYGVHGWNLSESAGLLDTEGRIGPYTLGMPR